MELVKFFTSLVPKNHGEVKDRGRMQTNRRDAMPKNKF
jgi:hypothetical protein